MCENMECMDCSAYKEQVASSFFERRTQKVYSAIGSVGDNRLVRMKTIKRCFHAYGFAKDEILKIIKIWEYEGKAKRISNNSIRLPVVIDK